MTENTHNGKIARLPRAIRDQLNRRLDNGEQSGPILAWLNALPEAQAMLAAEFGATEINKQNLTNWRQGGFQHWLKQQEHRQLVRELTENADELATEADGVEIANHLSTLLVAELAAAAREALAELTDPVERCVRLQENLHTLVRVRRQDYLAGKLAIARELRERDRAKEDENEKIRKEYQQENVAWTIGFRRAHMADLYAQPSITSQAEAGALAESLLRQTKPNVSQPNGRAAPVNHRTN